MIMGRAVTWVVADNRSDGRAEERGGSNAEEVDTRVGERRGKERGV